MTVQELAQLVNDLRDQLGTLAINASVYARHSADTANYRLRVDLINDIDAAQALLQRTYPASQECRIIAGH